LEAEKMDSEETIAGLENLIEDRKSFICKDTEKTTFSNMTLMF
jgi:hypothetical protein